MNYRYLYGKKEYLGDVISGRSLPRFSDLSHYKRLENNNMRDEEEYKSFYLNRNDAKITINGHTLNNADMVADIKMDIPVRHCYCACFSKRKNDPELFKTFNADICLEIDIDVLVGELTSIFSDFLVGTEVVCKDIEYFDAYTTVIDDISSAELVFYKPMSFRHESETRIALFYPENKSGFIDKDGNFIPIMMKGESSHLSIIGDSPDVRSRCVVSTFEPY